MFLGSMAFRMFPAELRADMFKRWLKNKPIFETKNSKKNAEACIDAVREQNKQTPPKGVGTNLMWRG